MPRGAWALWADVPAPARRELRGYYKDLRRRYGARTALERAALKILAELLFATATASAASAAASAKRSLGRGRRPSARQVNALLRRQGLQLGSLNQALPGGVAALVAGAAGPAPSIDDLAREVRARQAAREATP